MISLEKIAENSFIDELQKLSALTVDDVENRLGVMLTGTREQIAKNLINQEVARETPLRHPILTGIPTLGIAPVQAKKRALRRIERKMILTDSDLANVVSQIRTS